MKNRSQIIIFLIIAIFLGALLGMQLKFKINLLGFEAFSSEKKLRERYIELLDENKSNEKYLKKLDSDIDKKEKDEAKKSKEIDIKYNQLHTLKKSLGYEEVKGKGVIIEIRDPLYTGKDGENENLIVKNYSLLLQIVSILNDNGAEAIGINDERVTFFTDLESEGNSLLIGNKKVTTPIVITAIGDPQKLEGGLKIKGNVIWEMEKNWLYRISIRQGEKIKINRLNEMKNFEYAKSID